MIHVKGKHNTATVFTDNIESEAYKQILDLCNMEAYSNSKIAIMPDVHAGAGCTIGTTMLIHDIITPNLVGVDIGCGVLSYCLGDLSNITNLNEILDDIIRKNIPSGFNTHDKDTTDPTSRVNLTSIKIVNQELSNTINWSRVYKSMGTLGGGNHFIELGIDSSNNYWLTVHSGSRHLGKQVADFYQRKAIEICKDDVPNALKYLTKEDYFNEYIKMVHKVQWYATHNRATILNIIERKLKELLQIKEYRFNPTSIKQDIIETKHNYVEYLKCFHILRKGAISSSGLRTIPMNMRDGILIVEGKSNPDWNYSAPHGAGRIYSRSKAKQIFTLEEFQESMEGIYSSCISQSTLDESPMVYKDTQEIIKHTKDTLDVIDIIKPIYNFKA